MEWNEVEGVEDINKLLKTFGYFHDSCLKELVMWNDFHVQKDLSMAFGDGLDNNIKMLFQRQFNDPSAIELLFEGVKEFHLGDAGLILDANLILQDGMFIWADAYDWKPNDNDENITWIASMKVKWRDVSHWMGDERRYGELTES
ncbi:hypothetical protein [Sporosarcina sp. OR05]|uniref:hypothetical protein n=1 Tax=Sporosarcina sp. OR05 TaxID=2969819 RepID=UPI003529EF57